MTVMQDLSSFLGLNNSISVQPADVAPCGGAHVRMVQDLHRIFGDRRFARKDFHPKFLHRGLLRHVSLADVVRDGAGPSFQFRVFGTSLTDVVGKNLTGKTVMDFPKRSCRVYLTRLFSECADSGQIVFSDAYVDYPGCLVKSKKTFFPLFDNNGSTVEMILSAFTFEFDAVAYKANVDDLTEPVSVQENYRLFDTPSHYCEAAKAA